MAGRRRMLVAGVALIGAVLHVAPAWAMLAQAPQTPWAVPNGRVTAIARVNNVLYLGGQFTQITDIDGTTVLARDHLAAVSALDGHVLAWNPGANGVVRTLAVSTDGATIYLGGDFTSVGGAARSRLAAEAAILPTSTTTTGTLRGWAPRADGSVYTLAPLDGRIYVGGAFRHVNGFRRLRLAAVNATTGALSHWTPTADNDVNALLPSPTGGRIFAGGSFRRINGAPTQNVAAISAVTGRLTPWKSHASGHVLSLAENATSLFAGDAGGGGHLRSYLLSTGRLRWTNTSDGNVAGVTLIGRGANQQVIVGGHFNKFGKYTRHKVAAINPTTGLVDPTWSPYASGSILGVFGILGYGQHVYLGGDFTSWYHTGAGQIDQAHLADFALTDPPDTIPPTTIGPTATVPLGATLGTIKVPLRLRWSATDPASGICRYTLQRNYNTGPYQLLPLAYATATSTPTLATPSAHPYGLRVDATDCSDNTSPFVNGAPITLTATQNSSAAVSYRGAWAGVRLPRAYGRSVKQSDRAEATATFHFTGRDIAWVASRGPTHGSARVLIDGRTAAIVHTHAPTTQRRRVVFTHTWPTNGAHTIKIILLGTRGHPLVDIDALLTIR
jgi:hypothetical protein